MSYVKEFILVIAEYYKEPMNEVRLNMFAEDLADLSGEELKTAFNTYRKDPRNVRFPLPNQLRSALRPESDDGVAAIDLATRICSAVERRGWTWACENGNGVLPAYAPYKTFPEAVQRELGGIAWEVVSRFGGWTALCDALYDSDRTAFMAQMRERIVATMKLAKAGRLRANPELPLPSGHPIRLGDLLKNRAALEQSSKNGK